MADDGGWPGGLGPESWETGDARTRVALDRLRVVLGGAAGRLAEPSADLAQSPALTELLKALDDLSLGLAAHKAQVQVHAGHLAPTDADAAALRRLKERLAEPPPVQAARNAATAARLDAMFDEIGKARAAAEARRARKDPNLIRRVLAGAGAVAAVGVVGVGAALVASPAWRPGEEPAPVQAKPAPAPPQEAYAAVAEALARGEANALARLTTLAEAGDAAAQLHLASLYETGENGLPQDLAAARLWTGRAAQAGDGTAMHNMALFLMQGEGGEGNVAEAAVWFRKAAELGVVDSQYNLGLLYEAGRGVDRDLAEAYRWFSKAADAGDAAAREKQLKIQALLRAS